MKLDYNIKLDVTQKLVMTHELRQAIKVLQLSSIELTELIDQELLENPVLEIEEHASEQAEYDENTQNEQSSEYLDWGEYFNDGGAERFDRYDNTNGDEPLALKYAAQNPTSLHEHLEMQLNLSSCSNQVKLIGHYLIGCINENGYLCCSINEAIKALEVSNEQVLEVLKLIQTFDPAGVGARDLKECLLLQLEQSGIQNKVVIDIINKYLEDVAAGRYRLVAEKLNITTHNVQQAVDIIRTLDPKPGRIFSSEQPNYITPDITVRIINGKYVIIVNDNYVPRLNINPYYRKVAAEGDRESKKFIEGRLNSAVWLIKSIEQRRNTLYKFMETIIELQADFFANGPKFLRPLTMKQVAEQMEVHESTVSRATANKYVDTPYGIFSLRTFFSASVNSTAGEDIAATNVKQRIKELITSEEAKDPYSDQVLSDILGREGIKISRRTVAKYREEMGIVSSAKRKRY